MIRSFCIASAALLASTAVCSAQEWERTGDVVYGDTFTHISSFESEFGPLDLRFFESGSPGGGHLSVFVSITGGSGHPQLVFPPVDLCTYECYQGGVPAEGEPVGPGATPHGGLSISFGPAIDGGIDHALERNIDVVGEDTFYLGFLTGDGRTGFVQMHFERTTVDYFGLYTYTRDDFVLDGWALWDEGATGPFLAFDVAEGPVVEPVFCASDFDQDGDVDLGDFGVFGAAFGSTVADPHYNEACDFDNDGDVDLGDFGTFGAQFGTVTEDCAG